MPKKAKPAKPYDEFPLYAHGVGQWAKTIKGKTHYFGPWKDWKAALNRFLDQRDDLYAGRKPKQRSEEGHPLIECVNQFLADKEALLENGELKKRTWDDYDKTCRRIVAFLGRDRLAEDLSPADFAEFRKDLAKSRNPNTLSNEIGRVRAVFNHVGPKGIGWLESEVAFGSQFKKASKKAIRIHNSKKPTGEIPAIVIRTAAALASDQLAAMIFLAMNCGMGNNDCAQLMTNHIDWRAGWLSYPRPKTGVDRKGKLWPETIAALAATPNFPGIGKAISPSEAVPVFVTKYGNKWIGSSQSCPISAEWRKTLQYVGMHQDGRGFYSLRRTFQTVAEESGDFPAISMIMGHDDGTMASRYRQRISDERLTRVSDTVRSWLLLGTA